MRETSHTLWLLFAASITTSTFLQHEEMIKRHQRETMPPKSTTSLTDRVASESLWDPVGANASIWEQLKTSGKTTATAKLPNKALWSFTRNIRSYKATQALKDIMRPYKVGWNPMKPCTAAAKAKPTATANATAPSSSIKNNNNRNSPKCICNQSDRQPINKATVWYFFVNKRLRRLIKTYHEAL